MKPVPPKRSDLGVGLCVLAGLAVLPTARSGDQFAMIAPLASGSAGILFVALLVVHAALVASESAIETLRPMHLRAENSARAMPFLEDKPRYAAACNLAARFVRLLMLASLVDAAWAATADPTPAALRTLRDAGVAENLIEIVQGRFPAREFLLNLAWIGGLGALAAVILGELVPRAWGEVHPVRTVIRLRGTIRTAALLFSLPARLTVMVAGLIAGRFGGHAHLAPGEQAEEEIKSLVENAQESGAIEVDEKELLDSVFEFTDTVAREVMTPRTDLEAMPLRSDPGDVVTLVRESGHSRIPLYEGTDDQIVGIVHAKDLLLAMAENPGRPILLRSLLRPVLFVPENKNLHELIKEMREDKAQMAVVQDEFGGTAGIVTVEDIVEELVGDIVDEYDREEPDVVEETTGWLVDGKSRLDDFGDEIGVPLDSDEFDTVGGYVFGLFGRLPKEGETVEGDGLRFTVAEADTRRILKLRVEKLDAEA